MTCREAKQRLVEAFDVVPGAELLEHLEACRDCASEYEGLKAALASVQPVRKIRASGDFKERVMSKVSEEVEQTGRRRWFPAWVPKAALAGAVALGLIMIAPFVPNVGKGTHGQALGLLAQSVQAMSNLQSVHLSARMRTIPRDNFELIQLDREFVPIGIWRQFGDPPKWRIEKPGRVVAMDGGSTLMFIEPDRAVRGGPRTGFVEWLMPLLDPEQVLEGELRMARERRSAVSLAEETRGAARQLVLTATMKAQGDLTNDWVRNKSIIESDHTRIYRFDPLTKRLTGMQVFVHTERGDVLVFEVTEVSYNEPVDPVLFAIVLPAGVSWAVDAEDMPATRPLPSNPKDTAITFFESFAKEDWEGVLTVYPGSGPRDRAMKHFGGLQIISIGEPFQSGLYPGWFVPYEIKLRNGQVRKHNLAVRNDNRAQRFAVDGGF